MPAKAAPGEIRVTLTRKSLSQHGPVTNVFSFLFLKTKNVTYNQKGFVETFGKYLTCPLILTDFFINLGGIFLSRDLEEVSCLGWYNVTR